MTTTHSRPVAVSAPGIHADGRLIHTAPLAGPDTVAGTSPVGRRPRTPQLGGRRKSAGAAALLAPTLEAWAWQRLAACRGTDSSVFFAPPDEGSEARHRRETTARKVCATCPVRDACADFALRTREPYGVWGGLTEKERHPGRR